MDQQEWLARQFEDHRPHLRAVAYRMLGSLSEADDAVQDAWLRLSRADTSEVENLGGWLTTVVARVSLNMLRPAQPRRRSSRPRLAQNAARAAARCARARPDHRPRRGHRSRARGAARRLGRPGALVVLETLTPAERLAFVLHDMFAVPFEEIAPIVERSPEATRQLASRARRRVRGTAPVPDADLTAQWEVVEAFLAAARKGDFDALVAVLDPDVVLRADGGLTGLSQHVRGAGTVAGQALMWSRVDLTVRRALVKRRRRGRHLHARAAVLDRRGHDQERKDRRDRLPRRPRTRRGA